MISVDSERQTMGTPILCNKKSARTTNTKRISTR